MVYVRGHPLDFERWEAEGAKGWGYRSVLPYFRRAESFQGGADAYRGDAAPLAAAPRPMDPWVPASRLRRFIAGVGGRRAHAIPHRHVEGSKPLLPLAVEVGADRI